MKKITLAIIAVVLAISFLAACAGSKTCPAYGKVNTEKTDIRS